ncbi:hypothetical protein MUU49_14640 [Scandinavium goeteborgense]|uniref:hypothetical protein n=1 Tax=Scandinavium goeteborgense TaxID=1851514 RepID=UPI002166648D|nr:hypothetical protein [Scandinavium goeteborgense]MCS2153793.1 hypothetical protein [Scandinavium goeteborgense]
MKSLREELAKLNNHQDVKIKKIDLNLLPAFIKIFDNNNVDKAVNISEGSLSSATHVISKLSVYFNDPLFVRQGPALTATPLAVELYMQINEELDALLFNIENISCHQKCN